MDAVYAFLSTFATTHPWAVTILSVVGFLRLLNKPIFAALHAVGAVMPVVEKGTEAVEASPIYKGFAFVLDWFASVKLNPPAGPSASPAPQAVATKAPGA